jgi:hypothetical protein
MQRPKNYKSYDGLTLLTRTAAKNQELPKLREAIDVHTDWKFRDTVTTNSSPKTDLVEELLRKVFPRHKVALTTPETETGSAEMEEADEDVLSVVELWNSVLERKRPLEDERRADTRKRHLGNVGCDDLGGAQALRLEMRRYGSVCTKATTGASH